MQYEDNAPVEDQETPDTREEDTADTQEDSKVRTPRRVEPESEEEKPEGEAKGQEDIEKTLRSEIAKLKEQLAEVSDKVTRKEEPKEKEEAVSEEDLYKDLLVPDNWKPTKETYAALMQEVMKRNVELTRRVIADEVKKAHQAQQSQSQEDAEIVKTFYRGVDRLRAEGKLPTVKNPNDPNDPGIKAENTMKQLAARYNTVDLDMLYDDIYSKNLKTSRPANPISKPSKGTPDVGKVINYQKEVAGKSLMDILESEEEE